MAVTDTLPLRRLPFERLGAFPALFTTYCSDYAAVDAYYAGDFGDPEARAASAQRAAEHARDRDALADALLEQNEAWSPDDRVRRHVELLRDPEAVAVVTGQQVGLLTGPLYTPLKTITTLQLAERLAEETGRPVVPVFWLEGEDHDFDEMAGLQVLTRNEVAAVRYEADPTTADGHRGPVGQLVLTDAVGDVVDALDEALADTDFKPALMEHVRASYRPGTKMIDAFARFVRRLFPEAGLVFVSPNDTAAKRLTAGLFRKEIEAPMVSAGHVTARGEELEAAGYHAQIRTRATNLFLLENEGRLPLDYEDAEALFHLRGTDRRFGRDELLELLEAAPERFSPNVVLRPLMQDWLLPTAAYVAGPGEVSYFAQLGPVYEWVGVPMPVLHPRASATLVESKVEKVLERYDLDVPDLSGDLDRLFQHVVVREMEVDVEEAFQDVNRAVHQALNELKPVVEKVDRTLGKTTESARAALAKELGSLKGRVLRAEKRNQEEVRAQLEKAAVNLFPAGRPQERVLNVLYYLNKYSPDLLGELRATLSLDTTAHQVVQL